MEIKNNLSLPFLDVLVTYNLDGTTSHQVYTKKNHTNLYLNNNSHHHLTQKLGIPNTLFTCAFCISNIDHLNQEKSHLKETIQNNDYSTLQITKSLKYATHPNSHNTPQNNNAQDFLPFIKDTTNNLAKILKKENIKTIFKALKTTQNFLPSIEDMSNPLHS